MAMLFTKPLNRSVIIKQGAKEVELNLELTADGISVKRKGKRKVLTATWAELIGAGALAPAADSPALSGKEKALLEENPLAFFLAD